ncbi:MAG: hypothetical protein MAG431_00252 [Chloroflexi bacterium]|nr:hypothetical protein [Chloroflexota bacterium]
MAVFTKQPEGGDSSEFQAVFPWFGSAVGNHELKVVAYDNRRGASQPATAQIGVEPRTFEPPELDFVWEPPQTDQDGNITPGQVVPVNDIENGAAVGGDGAEGEDTAQPARCDPRGRRG